MRFHPCTHSIYRSGCPLSMQWVYCQFSTSSRVLLLYHCTYNLQQNPIITMCVHEDDAIMLLHRSSDWVHHTKLGMQSQLSVLLAILFLVTWLLINRSLTAHSTSLSVPSDYCNKYCFVVYKHSFKCIWLVRSHVTRTISATPVFIISWQNITRQSHQVFTIYVHVKLAKCPCKL